MKNIAYEMDQMPEFIVDQLASGILPAFLPVSFICERNQYTGIYNTEHYRPLSAVKEIAIQDFFQVLGQIITILAENEKHYVFGETYVLNRDTIYVNGLYTQVKLVFKPLDRLCTTKEQLIDFLQGCKNMVSDVGKLYLDDVCKYFTQEDIGYAGAIHHITQLQNEIYTCDIV